MLSLKEMFYGPPQPEEVWVVKDEKKQGGDNKKEETKSEAPAAATPLETAFGKYYPYYAGPAYKAPEATKPKVPNPERKVELKVPICCSDCVATITSVIKEIKGVKTVACDIGKEKVTVMALEAAKTDSIILACRDEYPFKSSRLWTSDD